MLYHHLGGTSFVVEYARLGIKALRHSPDYEERRGGPLGAVERASGDAAANTGCVSDRAAARRTGG